MDESRTWIEILEPTLRKLDQPPFVKFPKCVARCGALSTGSRLYYAILLDYAWQDDMRFPGQATLAKEVGCGERTLREYNEELAVACLLDVKRQGRGLTNRYTILPLDGFARWLRSQSRPADSADLERSFSAGLEPALFADLERSFSAGPIHVSSEGLLDARAALFETFWAAYPEHARGTKAPAEHAWRTAVASEDVAQTILDDIAARLASGEWTREGGRFVPRADRYLAHRKWQQPRRTSAAVSDAAGFYDGFKKFMDRGAHDQN